MGVVLIVEGFAGSAMVRPWMLFVMGNAFEFSFKSLLISSVMGVALRAAIRSTLRTDCLPGQFERQETMLRVNGLFSENTGNLNSISQ